MTRRFVLPGRETSSLEIDYETGLNEQQLAVVTCGTGPKIVIAGAGSGKTRTLTYRVAHLLEQGVAPAGILLVTFTNKAAREMLGRVEQLTSMSRHHLWGGTFHSVCARMLRRHAGLAGYTDSFSILDERDQRDLIKLCITDLDVPVKQRRFPSAKVLAGIFSMQANTRQPLEDLLGNRYIQFLEWLGTIEEIAGRYALRKQAANAMDYDDLLQRWLEVLKDNKQVRNRYREQFDHILVDEYQDTNIVQAEIVEVMAGGDKSVNLMVVGDDSQSIYAFRGANYDNILNFPKRNKTTEVFRLETNYRSTPQILHLTNASIEHNKKQHRKVLRAERANGILPALIPCSSSEQEAEFVAERILQLRDEGVALSDIAVLYRAHSHRLSVETTLLRYDIPYEVRGGLRFFQQAHIKDLIAHLRLVENPRDEVAFRRVLLLQPGIGNVTANRIWNAIAAQASEGDALVSAFENMDIAGLLPSKARSYWPGFAKMIRDIHASQDEPETAISIVLDSGYTEYVLAKFDNSESRIEDLQQLAIFADQYDSLNRLLEELLLLGELYGQEMSPDGRSNDDESPIVLSTIHQAKGLEWHSVFIICLLEGFFPSQRSLDEPGGEEEERRIFYVATTRSRDELYLSYPIVRAGGYGASVVQQPSRFLQELPETSYEAWQLEEESTGVASPNAGVSQDFDPNVDPVWDDDAPLEEPWLTD
jgi:DNA helicase-2/ATP-dependent DNA helicase PcrA